MRLVLDTDVIVAAVISTRSASRLWLGATLRGEVKLLISVPLALEYEAVLKRPGILERTRLVESDIDRMLDGLARIRLGEHFLLVATVIARSGG
jgi:predicted nucleic acid-binding protein